MRIAQVFKAFEKFAVDNSPSILTVIGVTGTITAAVFTGKASYKAALMIHDVEEEQQGYLSLKEKAKVVWKLYIPPISIAALTVTSIICANRIGARRAAAMAAAYTISERAFEEYRDKIVERLGANKEREARDEIAQDRMNRNPLSNNQIIVTDNGDVPCYDVYTGRYFKSSMEALKKAQNDLNYTILNNQYASLNDFYNKIGLPNIPQGEEVGWNSDELLDIFFSVTMTDDQKPAISIEFHVKPVRNYFRTH